MSTLFPNILYNRHGQVEELPDVDTKQYNVFFLINDGLRQITVSSLDKQSAVVLARAEHTEHANDPVWAVEAVSDAEEFGWYREA